MATVTIARSHFEALSRRAELHTQNQELGIGLNLSNNVTISKAEHERLLQAVRQYNQLKSALFRGGLTQETLDTLLQGESAAMTDDATTNDASTEKANFVPNSQNTSQRNQSPRGSDDTLHQNAHWRKNMPRAASYDAYDSLDSPRDDQDRIPVHDQRTIYLTNLPERTTHKDLAGIIRGGRLLDIFLRSDRSASISFVEGAANFLSYAKRNDIYLHTKRLECRWADRQFHVPGHVSQKIANGATRNLVVRGGAARLTPDMIRDHLDHIHNLVVVDIYTKKEDVYISTNSVHNALFARTCMMSRTVYKGMRVEFSEDECAQPLPRPAMRTITSSLASKKATIKTNTYALLDDGSDIESDSEDSYVTEGIRLDHHSWIRASVA